MLDAQLREAQHGLGNEAGTNKFRRGIELHAGEGDEQMLMHQRQPKLVEADPPKARLNLLRRLLYQSGFIGGSSSAASRPSSYKPIFQRQKSAGGGWISAIAPSRNSCSVRLPLKMPCAPPRVSATRVIRLTACPTAHFARYSAAVFGASRTASSSRYAGPSLPLPGANALDDGCVC